MKWLNKFFQTLIRLYQISLSPYLGKNCRFQPTCSSYAIQCFDNFPAPLALWYSCNRICKCHPFHPGGEDPVPGVLKKV
ncbi:MAG: membrane protein insertion efficiency factor YidD [Halobacteriovoraceae bacterium]|nr:membrane protein insertion efficiency factor YidD [Halobacteriovoraceae bacterium]